MSLMTAVSNFQKGVKSVLQLRDNTLKEIKHCSSFLCVGP